MGGGHEPAEHGVWGKLGEGIPCGGRLALDQGSTRSAVTASAAARRSGGDPACCRTEGREGQCGLERCVLLRPEPKLAEEEAKTWRLLHTWLPCASQACWRSFV